MNSICSSTFRLVLAFQALASLTLPARPVDLSAPPGAFGPATAQGHALHWLEFTEIDFGGGLTLPLRMSFLSGRDGDSADFGAEGWRSPLFTSRLMGKTKDTWPVLLPCGKLMDMTPQPGNPKQWGTPDGEWIAKARGGNTLVSREDGWEMEFDRRGLLVRLRTDAGRNVLWSRNAEGGLIALSELVNGRPAPSAFVVQRDAATGLVSAMEAKTSYGTKVWSLAFDAERRLSKVAFPDGTSALAAYDATAEGHPRITITGRDLIKSTLAWHKDTLTLVSDGVWSYNIVPQTGTGLIMNRTGPHGETESYQDDHRSDRSIFTAADGTTTIKHKVKAGGPAKGKIERITRSTGFQPVSPAGVPPAAKEATLYSATYDSRGMFSAETDALGRKTKHTYVLHGASPHSGIHRHTATDPLGGTRTEEFDIRGNLIAITDPLGHTIRYEFDSQNRRTKTLGPDGAVIESLTYTAAGQIASSTNALGATTQYGYDQHGNRITTTDALGHVTKDAFDARGNRTSTTDALGRAWKFAYDLGGRLIREFDPEENETASYGYDAQGRRTAVTDAAGKTSTVEYDLLGRITARTDALGRATKYSYEVKKGAAGCTACSASALPTLITLPSGRQIHRVYDADKRLIEESSTAQGSAGIPPVQKQPKPPSTRHTYDLAGNLLSTTDPLGRTTTHEYDAADRRIKTIHPDKTSRTFAYNAAGRLIAETDELGHTTKREYDPYGNLIAATNPEGQVTKTLFDSGATFQVARGVPAPSPASNTAVPAVSPAGGPPAAKDKQAGSLPHFAAARRPTGILTAAGVRTAFLYDALGRRIAEIKGSQTGVTTALETLAKSPAALHDPKSAFRTPNSELSLTSREFDAVGNEIKSTNPAGRSLAHTYDSRHRRITTTDVLGRRWQFSYTATAGASGPAPCCGSPPESNAKAAETLFPDGTKETTVTDAAGQVIEKIDAKGDSTKFSYDPDGRLATLTDGRGSITRWNYDAAGKLSAKVYPDKTMEIYEHDAAGQLTRKVRPSGTAAAYTYDPRGRLLSIQWDDGKTEPSTFAYDAAGRMTKAINPSAAIERAYSPTGKLKSEIQKITASFDSSIPHSALPILHSEVRYSHDLDGRLAAITYPDHTALHYTYNPRGELSEVTSPSHLNPNRADDKTGLIARYTRHPDGAIARLEMGNGLITTKDYDLAGRLIKTTHSRVGVPPNRNTAVPAVSVQGGSPGSPNQADGSSALHILESETLRYDDRDRRTARIRQDGQADLFAYDPAGQVIAAAYGSAGVPPVHSSTPQPAATNPNPPKTETEHPNKPFTPSQTFAYDAAGNRMKTTDSGQSTEYRANENNQYTQLALSGEVFTPEYDKNGNLLKDPARTYTWDADIHLMSVASNADVSSASATTQGSAGVPPVSNGSKTKQPTKNTESTKAEAKSKIQNQKSEITESFRYDALHRRVARQVTRSTAVPAVSPAGVPPASSGTAGQRPAAHTGGTPVLLSETTYFIMDGWNVIAEYKSTFASTAPAKADAPTPHSEIHTPNLSAKHLWGEDLSRTLQGAGGIGGLLASAHFIQPPSTTANNRQQQQTHFLSYDSNGNVILLTDSSCTPSARYRYDAFGKTTLASGPAAEWNKYRFSTKPIAIWSGLAFYGYRYYDPGTGRWQSRDPIGMSGGINLFKAMGNDAIGKVDLLGTNPIFIPCNYNQLIMCINQCLNSGMVMVSCEVAYYGCSITPPALLTFFDCECKKKDCIKIHDGPFNPSDYPNMQIPEDLIPIIDELDVHECEYLCSNGIQTTFSFGVPCPETVPDVGGHLGFFPPRN